MGSSMLPIAIPTINKTEYTKSQITGTHSQLFTSDTKLTLYHYRNLILYIIYFLGMVSWFDNASLLSHSILVVDIWCIVRGPLRSII